MKKLCAPVLALLLIGCSLVSYSQKITTGVYSGINFSDIHGQDFGGRWVAKPGPSEGLSLGYLFNESLGFQTGLGYSNVYYQHKTYNYYYPPVFYNDEIGPSYSYQEISDFRILRVPVMLTISVPSELQFTIRAGIYFSFLKYNSSQYNSYYPYYSPQTEFSKKDFGYIFSSGISYPLSEKLKASLNASYITGRKEFQEYSGRRHGSSEFTLGITYEFPLKKKSEEILLPVSDTSSKKVTITYRAGIDYSWIKNTTASSDYSSVFGQSLGFSVNIPLGHGVDFVTGFTFERKGYSMKDSSAVFYMYRKASPMYDVNSKVLTDYGVIPFLLSFPMDRSRNIRFKTGPWLGLKLNSHNVGVAYNEVLSGTSYLVNKTTLYDDLQDYISDNDMGWIFGLGVELPLKNKYQVELGVEYSAGFKNMYKKSKLAIVQYPVPEDQEFRNRTLSFVLGITIPSKEH